MKACKPRRLKAEGAILIFTDASWESEVGGLGAVVIDTVGGRTAIYSGQIADAVKLHWHREVGEHLFCQLELYVMVNLRWSLKNFFHNRQTIWWVDNDAANFSLIKGQSGSESMNR